MNRSRDSVWEMKAALPSGLKSLPNTCSCIITLRPSISSSLYEQLSLGKRHLHRQQTTRTDLRRFPCEFSTLFSARHNPSFILYLAGRMINLFHKAFKDQSEQRTEEGDSTCDLAKRIFIKVMFKDFPHQVHIKHCDFLIG